MIFVLPPHAVAESVVGVRHTVIDLQNDIFARTRGRLREIKNLRYRLEIEHNHKNVKCILSARGPRILLPLPLNQDRYI